MIETFILEPALTDRSTIERFGFQCICLLGTVLSKVLIHRAVVRVNFSDERLNLLIRIAAGSLFVYQKKDMGVLINFPKEKIEAILALNPSI